MTRKKTRNKPSHYPAWLPKFYCTEEMRDVIKTMAEGDGLDISKELRSLLEQSPRYKQAREIFLINKQQHNETNRTISV